MLGLGGIFNFQGALAADVSCDELKNDQSVESTLSKTKEQLCCGNSLEAGTGAVRGLYPQIDHKSCLEKINPSTNPSTLEKQTASCAANVIQEALTAVWNNLKGMVNLPEELWAARSQIWQLMTNAEAREEFSRRFTLAIKKFVDDRVDSVGSCLNEQEKNQIYCKISGQVVGEFATPLGIVKLFNVVKSSAKAGELISETLNKTPKGQELLAGLESAQKKSRDAVQNIGGGRGVSDRTQNAVNRVMKQAKYSGQTLEQVVHKNALLTDAERAAELKKDFPQLSNQQIEGIVKDVHSIGSQRSGAGVYKYTEAEILAKMKKLKELGVESDDRRAILSLGYAGEIETDPAYFKSFLDKELKIAAEKNKPATPPDAKDSESLSALLKRMDQERALQMSIRNKSNPPK
jgi:hypothetical protein